MKKTIKGGSLTAALPLIQEASSQVNDLLGTIFGNAISKPKKTKKAKGIKKPKKIKGKAVTSNTSYLLP